MVLPYINMNPPQVYTCSPSWTVLPLPSLYHPSASSQCTSPKHQVSCIKPGLATCFTYDSIHVSMPRLFLWGHMHPCENISTCCPVVRPLPGHECVFKVNLVPQDHPGLGGSGLASQLEAPAVLVGHCCKGDCSLFYGDRVVFVPPTKVTSSPLNTVIPKISHLLFGDTLVVFWKRNFRSERGSHEYSRGSVDLGCLSKGWGSRPPSLECDVPTEWPLATLGQMGGWHHQVGSIPLRSDWDWGLLFSRFSEPPGPLAGRSGRQVRYRRQPVTLVSPTGRAHLSCPTLRELKGPFSWLRSGPTMSSNTLDSNLPLGLTACRSGQVGVM